MEYWDTKTHKNDSAPCSYQIHRSVKKIDRNEINSVDDLRVWLSFWITC